MANYNKYKLRDLLSINSALSDENRLRALMALLPGELCVCQIIELLNLAPSTVSKHMSVLKQARLVDSRKDGRWIYYRLADKDAPVEVLESIQWLKNSLKSDRQIAADKTRIRQICKKDKKDLCRKQD